MICSNDKDVIVVTLLICGTRSIPICLDICFYLTRIRRSEYQHNDFFSRCRHIFIPPLEILNL